MKKQLMTHIVLGLMLIWGTSSTFAQEKFYMKNGNAFNNRLVEASDGSIKYYQTNGDRKILRTFSRENILVTFNAKGDYLMVANIKKSAEESRRQLEAFYAGDGPKSDIIISAVPLKVIVCKSPPYEGESAVNYKNENGQVASMPKSNVVAIIRANGQHEILQDLAEAASTLESAWPDFQSKKGVAVSQESKEEEDARLKAEAAERKRLADEKQRIEAENRLHNLGQMTDQDMEEYKAKAIDKVAEFASYLQIITNKKLPVSQQDDAIDQAVKLFLPDAMIEVSSASRSKTNKYPVREYLTRLKFLPYGKIDIAWNEIQYVSKPELEADGNYYGNIRGVQTFTGYGNGANRDQVQYSDVTPKNIRTKFESYNKIIDSINVTKWGVLLGNIGVGNYKR